MADNFAIGLLGAMDHLWFHHVILFSDPSSLKPLLAASKSLSHSSSSNNSQPSSVSEEENTLLEVNTGTAKQDDQCDEQDSKKETTPTETKRERPTRFNLTASKSRSHSSSPSSQKRSKNLRNAGGAIRLQKTMSCKSLCELELKEVQGFMDLGFRFNKDHLSKRMMSLIPGLQRLELFNTEERNILNPEGVALVDGTEEQEKEEDEEERGRIARPYLSEAWLIKRPDSPLLNLRIPRLSTAADMKKHLKYWAKTVASAIRQES